MTEERKARAMEIWQRACAAHEDAAVRGDSLRDNMIAGDQDAASVIAAALAERDAPAANDRCRAPEQGREAVKPPTITSTYAILDVMKGRKKLVKHLKKHGPMRVLIEATITDEYGADDGDSIEFNCDVHSVTTRKD